MIKIMVVVVLFNLVSGRSKVKKVKFGIEYSREKM